MKRMGILGGTFNPVHMGHLTVAQMVHEKLKLDRVIFVPSHIPPHKKSTNIASPQDRLHMLRLAIRGNPTFEVSNYEIQKKGKSYSIDTIHYFHERYPHRTKFFFIIGIDLLPTLHRWKRVEEMLKMVTFVAVNRPGFKKRTAKIKVRIVNVPVVQTSSTFVRQRIMAGKTIKFLVPDTVLDYIERNKLYQ